MRDGVSDGGLRLKKIDPFVHQFPTVRCQAIDLLERSHFEVEFVATRRKGSERFDPIVGEEIENAARILFRYALLWIFVIFERCRLARAESFQDEEILFPRFGIVRLLLQFQNALNGVVARKEAPLVEIRYEPYRRLRPSSTEFLLR